MEEAHRKRCKRYDIPGQAHCLTFSCFQKRKFLARDLSCQWLADAIERARDHKMFDLWGFAFMPDHVHLILLPQPNVKISQILCAIKSSISKRAILWVRRNTPAFLKQMEDAQPNGIVHHRFWQRGGGYDRNLRSVADVREKIRYVHDNPVRRGLVNAPDQWHWSSYAAWQTGQDHPIALDRESLMSL